MKKLSLLVFSVVLAAIVAGCTKENASEITGFTGIEVEVGENNGNSRLLILNEGAFPGASTLDLLDFKTKTYYADVFGQANPEVPQGIGNTGNDMAWVDGNLWVLLNASNQVAVLAFPSCKLIRTLAVDSPRHITVEGQYAYISSYGAAVYGGDPVEGKVYRINLSTYASEELTVGYQPEGLAVSGGKLYVANSGGYNWVHDNRVSVIDINTFKLEKQIELPVSNLNLMEMMGGKIWVNTYGESTWYEETPGNWVQTVSAPMSLVFLETNGTSQVIEGVHADKMTLAGAYIYAFGNDAEMTGGYDLCLYKVNTADGTFKATHFAGSDLSRIGYPYGLLVNPANGDIYICDASFTAGSKLHCFDTNCKWKWTVDTGVGTGHLLLQ
jgi:DNA-binding beta-propeller fold protein YncE